LRENEIETGGFVWWVVSQTGTKGRIAGPIAAESSPRREWPGVGRNATCQRQLSRLRPLRLLGTSNIEQWPVNHPRNRALPPTEAVVA